MEFVIQNLFIIFFVRYYAIFMNKILILVILDEVFDVAVNLLRSSPTFGKWTGIQLSAESKKQFWIQPGFRHGFVVRSEVVEFLYLERFRFRFRGCLLE